MRLTTVEQLKEVEAGSTLFLINPLGQGDQSRVSIEMFTISEVDDERFEGRKRFLSLDIDSIGRHFFTDMLSSCKYVYTELAEADSTLVEVRAGIHKEAVGAHHASCDSLLGLTA